MIDMEELRQEASGVSTAPSDGQSRALTILASELLAVEAKIAEHESAISDLKKRQKAIKFTELPDLMKEIGQDKVGLPSWNCDVLLEAYYHANISADWDSDRREVAFAHLDSVGGGDIIKTQLSLSAGRGEYDKMQRVAARVRQMLAEEDLSAEMTMDLSVPWNTLTAFVKEQVRAGTVIDLEKLGATVGSTVKIKKRKEV